MNNKKTNEVNKMMLTTLQEEILEEKIKIEKLDIAKKSIEEGLSIEVIAKITGLSIEEIKTLEGEIKS